VLNCIPARKTGLASFAPPEYELLFNQELSHNDGLLTESFMRMHDISFEEANLLIEKQVNELKTSYRPANRYFLVIWAVFGLTTKDIMYSHPINLFVPNILGYRKFR
jgi:hypothetical protein